MTTTQQMKNQTSQYGGYLIFTVLDIKHKKYGAYVILLRSDNMVFDGSY